MFVDKDCFLGHNELDLWSIQFRWHRSENLDQPYLTEYKRIFPPSEPQDGLDDRNRLSSLKSDLSLAACEKNEKYRKVALNNMLYLPEKYSETPVSGLPKYDPSKDPKIRSPEHTPALTIYH